MRAIILPPEELAGQNAETIVPASAKVSEAFATLYTIVARLRAQDGCPWDREQTPSSIRNNIIEEAYELVEAITEKDADHTKEEAGDLFMLATMVAYMFEQDKAFSVADSLLSVSEKLVRRHPHVFGDSDVSTSDGVVEQWNQIKEQKEGRRKKDSLLDEVPRHLPPLERAYKLQKKASKVGFDWTEGDAVWDKVEEELREARTAMKAQSPEELEEEIGDLIFSITNLSRFLGIDPAIALQRTNEKFSHRFRHVEKRMKEEGLTLSSEHMTKMDAFWDEAKQGH
ncbi:MAG TPA: nucleoside triphosphate pyrophosphohydrolase [Rectinemataceae bacterium]|nr:nucleoside triphosphate pyrophosphohydrolase [Rectinemataceae bacterium]